MSEARFDRIESWQTNADERLARIDQGLDGLRADMQDMHGRFDELRRHAGVLYEEALDRIAAIPDSAARLEARMDRGFAELKETIGRRLEPLETAVRHHSVEIDRLKKRRA